MSNAISRRQPEKSGSGSNSVCEKRMKDGRCGRPVYRGGVCLMHSDDPNKDNKKFQEEIDTILTNAGGGDADFWGFFFPRSLYSGREFAAKCLFVDTTFMQDADFSCTRFEKDVNFGQATFCRHASFQGATFEQGAYFSLAEFPKVADFRQTTFSGPAEFRETVFRGDRTLRKEEGEGTKLSPGPVFWMARFEKPKATTFYWTYLGQALLHGCDFSDVLFSQVTWRKRRCGRSMLFEEVASLNPEEGFIPGAPSLDEALKPLRANRATNSADRPNGNHGDDRNFKYVMEIYQQLKKNFENRGDDLTASDFYYGQMEMRRLPTLRHARLARWLARNLGLMGLYRKVSEYGESYWRPLVWVFVVAAIFTFVYPIFGLRRLPEKGKGGASNSGQGNIATVTAPVLTYWQPMEGADEQGKKKCRLRMTLVGQSFMTSLGVAFFQRDIAVFEPTYPWGRMLQSLELLLTYALLAVFLQVLGRKFKR